MIGEGELTLGAASSYLTGAVEYIGVTDPEWKPFDPAVPVAPNIILSWRFRLRRPRQTRIREMSDGLGFKEDRTKDACNAFGERLTREICGFLSVECKHLNSQLGADRVEREFLEKR